MEFVQAGLGHSPNRHGTLSHSANGGGWAALDHNSIGCLLASLHSARDLAAMQLVCHELHALASHNSFWLPVLATEFGLELQVRGTVAWAWSRDAQMPRMLQTAVCMPWTARVDLQGGCTSACALRYPCSTACQSQMALNTSVMVCVAVHGGTPRAVLCNSQACISTPLSRANHMQQHSEALPFVAALTHHCNLCTPWQDSTAFSAQNIYKELHLRTRVTTPADKAATAATAAATPAATAAGAVAGSSGGEAGPSGGRVAGSSGGEGQLSCNLQGGSMARRMGYPIRYHALYTDGASKTLGSTGAIIRFWVRLEEACGRAAAWVGRWGYSRRYRALRIAST